MLKRTKHCSQNQAENINLNRIHLRQAQSVVLRGGIIAYPTEGVYGLGCLPYLGEAVQQILDLKRRSVDKGFILVAASSEQLLPYVVFPDKETQDRVLATWPGPVTWVLPAGKNVPFWITGKYESVAARVSNHPVIQGICNRTGVIISTSANPETCPPARDARKVRFYFNNYVDYVYPGNVGRLSGPTEIRDAMTGDILREVH